MENNNARREILNDIELGESLLLDGFDNAIVGYDGESSRIVYDFELMAECLMDQDGMDYEEAVEFIEYNTIRAIPYFASEGPTPIVMRGLSDYFDWAEIDSQIPIDYNFNANHHLNQCVEWVRTWFEENGKGCNAVIGMSGGKDSTIAAAILCLALGCDRVIGVAMPDKGQGVNDADKICKHLGIKYMCMPIEDITSGFNRMWYHLGDDDFKWSEQSAQNIPPRIRMAMLFAVAQTFNGRVVNTCNLSEEYIGYSTIFGDNAGSFSPIRDLTVTEILAIGDELGLPREWVHKIPDDGLPHSMPDEEKFGFSYETLDKWIREGVKPSDETFEKIMKMHQNNLFKTRMVHIPSYNPNLPVH